MSVVPSRRAGVPRVRPHAHRLDRLGVGHHDDESVVACGASRPCSRSSCQAGDERGVVVGPKEDNGFIADLYTRLGAQRR